MVYLGDMDGKVYALNLADGKEMWTYKVESGFIASPAIRGGLLYLGDIDGKFYALDIKTGKPKWTFDAEAEIDSAANFWKDNVLFGSQDANLYCLNAETRQAGLEVRDRGPDSLHADGRRRPLVRRRLRQHAAHHRPDARQGSRPACRSRPRRASRRRCWAINVFFGTEAGTFFAVNWKEAKVAWKAEDQASSQPYRSSPAVQEGIVVVGSRNRARAGLRSGDGQRAVELRDEAADR